MIAKISALGRNTALIQLDSERGEGLVLGVVWDEMRARWTVTSVLRDTRTGNILTEERETKHEPKIKGKAALRAK